MTICSEDSIRDKLETFEELSHYLSSLIRVTTTKYSRKSYVGDGTNISNRNRDWKEEYTRVQVLWKKNPSRCMRRILSDQLQRHIARRDKINPNLWDCTFLARTTAAGPPECSEVFLYR